MTRATSMLEDAWYRATDFHEPTPESQSFLDDWAADDVASDTGIPRAQVEAHAGDPRWKKVWARAAEIRESHGESAPHEPEYDQQAFKEIFG